SQPFGYGQGADNSQFSEETQQRIDHEIASIVNRNYEEAKRILIENRDALTRLSEALIVWETLDSKQINEIMQGKDIGIPVLTTASESESVEEAEKNKKNTDNVKPTTKLSPA